MNYIILNGVDSRSLQGLIIQSLPPITKPAMRAEVEEIDGRDGDVITKLGYAAYDKTLSIGLHGVFDIDGVIEFFNTSGTVTFSNENDKVYQYQMLNQIDFERLIRFRTAEITLHVQPFKMSLAEKPLTFSPRTSSGTGTTVTLNPTAAGDVLTTFSLYGNTIQNTTPTTSNPVEIQNVTAQNNIVFTSGTLSSVAPLNLGTLELCKIGSYQDFIHQINGEWNKRTAIAEYTVNVDNVRLQTYSNVVYATFPKPTDALCYGNYKDIQCFCSHALYSYGLSEGWNTANAVNKIFAQADENTFWVGFPTGTTLEQAKAALSGCVIRYVLTARQDVPITDANLTTQLDEVLQISLFDGSTTISVQTSNAPPTIQTATVCASFTVNNIGNTYSRPLITVYGEGTLNITVNGQQIFTIALNNDGYITIDGAAMEAYQGGLFKNRSVTGNYDNFIFNTGKNTIAIGGKFTELTVDNYSRWI